MNELATTQPQMISTLDDMERVAKTIGNSGLFGIKTPEQAMSLMLLCQAEGLNPISALKRYHIIENRPSMRADAMQGEFEAHGGAIIFHVRTDEMVAATLFSDKTKIDDKARERAIKRFDVLWELETAESNARGKLMGEVAKLSREGEETLIRTYADAESKGITLGRDGTKANWKTSPRQMLTARVVTEGVRLLNPGLIAGIYSEDETLDIVRQEREFETKVLTNGATPRDKAAIQAMIDQHLASADRATSTEEKKRYQGLAAELRVTLADMDVQPETKPEIKTIEANATVEPPQKKATRKKPETPIHMDTPEPQKWQDVVSHIGSLGGMVLGETMVELFKPYRSAKRAKGTIDYFEANLAKSPIAKDIALLVAAREGFKAWEAAQTEAPKTPASEPEPEPATPTTQETPKPSHQPAKATEWGEYIVESKLPSRNGKKLKDFSHAEIHEIKTDYLDKVDWSKATLKQKTMKVMVEIALAELSGRPTPKEEASEYALSGDDENTRQHHVKLMEALKSNSIHVDAFLRECGKAGWIGDAKTIKDISEADCNSLMEDMDSVATQCDVLPI